MKYFASTFGAGLGVAAIMLVKIVYDAAASDRLIAGLLIGLAFFIANAGENGIVARLTMRAGELGANAARGRAPDVIDVQARQARAELDAERAAWYGRKDRPRALPAWAHGADDDDDGEVVL